MKSPANLYSVIADCTHCQIEGAVIEWYDVEHMGFSLGLPAEAYCRACEWRGMTHELSTPTFIVDTPPIDLSHPERAQEAIRRWAADEGETDINSFCHANFGNSWEQVMLRLQQKQPISSSFDVVNWLFSSSGGGSRSQSSVFQDTLPLVVQLSTAIIAQPDIRAVVRLWASVAVADGTLQKKELAWLHRQIASKSWPALSESELRLWRPFELGPRPPNAEEAIQAAFELAWIDHELDPQEERIIIAVAHQWGIGDNALQQWRISARSRGATVLSRLYERLSQWIRLH